jgi:hypothetical protein
MRNLLTICAAVVIFAPCIAWGNIINGGFETGDFTGWSTIGIVSIETAAFGTGPNEGTYQGFLRTPDRHEREGLEEHEIEEFLGLPIGSLDNLGPYNAINGSAMKKDITAEAGQTLTFDWNFITNEMTGGQDPDPFGWYDFSFVFVNDTGFILADTFEPTFSDSGSSFYKETGFQTFSHTFTTNGVYSLSIGVMNGGDDVIRSGLVVDNAVIPEPATLLLLGLGAVMVIRKQSNKKPLRWQGQC